MDHPPQPDDAEQLEDFELLDLLLEDEAAAQSDCMTPREDPSSAPLSHGQKRLWFIDQMQSEHHAYIIFGAFRLEGALERRLLTESVALLMERHESLRTAIGDSGEGPIQCIHPQLEPPVTFHAGQHKDESTFIRDETRRGFRLDEAPLMRVSVLEQSNTCWSVVFALHHIISDGWTMALLVDELAQIWEALAQNRPVSLSPLTHQYGDYSTWLEKREKHPDFQRKLSYWTRALEDLPLLELPTISPKPALQTFDGSIANFSLSREATDGVHRLARDTESSVFNVLLAATFVLLSRYAGKTDFAIGCPEANRMLPGTEKIFGFFANTLMIRADLSRNPSFASFVKTVRDTFFAAQEHSEVPFEKLVEVLNPDRDLSTPPLIEASFTLNSPLEEKMELSSLRLSPIPPQEVVAKFPLMVAMWEGIGCMQGFFQYNRDLFSSAHIEQMIADFLGLIDRVTENGSSRLSDLWGSAQPESLASSTHKPPLIPDLIRHQINMRPQAPAIVSKEETWSFARWDTEAQKIAGGLRQSGIRAGDRILVSVEQTGSWICLLWAIWKVGGTPVSTDVEIPSQRLEFIARESKVRLTVVDRTNRIAVPTICLGELRASSANPKSDWKTSPEAGAYIIYTSGSTGQPKGVLVSHAALANLCQWHENAFGVRPGDRCTQVASPGFDASMWELWPSLSRGAAVHLTEPDTMLDPIDLTSFLKAQQITHAFLPTTVAEKFIEKAHEIPSLRYLLTGGDRLKRHPKTETNYRVINNYGPTENAVVATSGHVIPRAGPHFPSIGQAIDGVRVYILDSWLSPVPTGVPGELYIAGNSLADGYIERADETAERFLPNPFAQTPSSRMYRTGDRALWNGNGDLQFLGRTDSQVSLRGHRIELSEVARAVRSLPAVQEAEILVHNEALVTYVALKRPTSKVEDLIDDLRRVLPGYMVPQRWIVLDTLPTTNNGKVDRKRLIALSNDTRKHTAGEAQLQTSTERRVSEVWQRHLKVEPLSRGDNFFNLGGHSMLAARIVAELSKVLGIDIPMRSLFEAPDLAAVARGIDHLLQGGVSSYFNELDPAFLEAEAVRGLQTIPQEIPPIEHKDLDKTVLITGATGFLGAYLCREWSAFAGKIICHVRAENPESGRERLASAWGRYGFGALAFSPSVEVVCGDLSTPRLGMNSSDWKRCSKEVTRIIHNGAQVHFMDAYSALKDANVSGTAAILELATEGRIKPVSFVSSLSVLGAELETTDEHAELTVPSGLGNGYAQSKWVAEKMIHGARERGLSIKIHRPSRIVGDSETGAWNGEDFACRMIRGCAELGCFPSVQGGDNLIAVDVAARQMVALDRADSMDSFVFHHAGEVPTSWSLFVDAVRTAGFPLEELSYSDWRTTLEQSIRDGDENALTELLGMFPPAVENAWEQDHGTPANGRVQCIHTYRQLAALGIHPNAVEEVHVDRFIECLIRSGLLSHPDHATLTFSR